MSLFVTSDLHLNHAGIMKYCPKTRGHFTSVAEMNDALINNWNAMVGPRDDVWVLGDFAFSEANDRPVIDLFNALNGIKHLVVGNHDQKNKKVLALPWVTMVFYHVLRYEGERAVLSHYPFETWDRAPKGYLHFHGHSHGTLKRTLPHRFDVGVDVPDWNLAPIPFETLVNIAATQEFEPTDHHGD